MIVKGAGAALLDHAAKLGRSLVGMSKVLGEIPLTVKLRTGVAETRNTAHKIMPRLQTEWGVGATTVCVFLSSCLRTWVESSRSFVLF